MPEYLAPGVFIEEVSYRAKSIEGVSTTTTGFVGPTRYGPTDLEPDILTSLVEFERIYGGRGRLVWNGAEIDNYMWNAVRAFFEEGGKRLYVARVFKAGATDGRAIRTAVNGIRMSARFPGAAGNGRLSLQFALGQNRLVFEGTRAVLKGLGHGDVVYFEYRNVPAPTADQIATTGFHLLKWDGPAAKWRFTRIDTSGPTPTETGFYLDDARVTTAVWVRRASVSAFYEPASTDLPTFAQVDMALDGSHRNAGTPDSLLQVFAKQPANAGAARSLPIVIARASGTVDPTGLELIADFTSAAGSATKVRLADLTADVADLTKTTLTFVLDGGNDGVEPDSLSYEGSVDAITNLSTGLKAFENLEDISIVAAPGSSATVTNAQAIANGLIAHAQAMKYRIAVIDSVRNQSISDVRAYRGKFDSKYAAFYYPWVRIIDPVSNQENHYPPSGFVAGIYARNDVERAVYKAPANEVVNLAIGFEKFLNKGQQEVLNPEGINCFRFFEGRGMRLWGARTMTSDPEWKYVNLRRYFAYLEHSIDRGSQWAVFEPNGERLWANVRRSVEDFLLNEWQMGALLGDKPEKAFFVKCDRTTMTQNDLDNGRLVCLVGVAALTPAEFVIFRIGQWTADHKV
jgi:phage tail sheath protein FI